MADHGFSAGYGNFIRSLAKNSFIALVSALSFNEVEVRER